MTLALEIVPGDAPYAEAVWRELEPRARPAFFLSWGWIENWLACLPDDHRPKLAVAADGGTPIAAAFFVHRRMMTHHAWPTRALVLHATGVARYDELVVEHNGLLRVTPVTLGEFAARLGGHWDELWLPGIDARELAGLDAAGDAIRIDRDVAAPYVDLARVRATPGGYLMVVGAHTRAMLRRARRGAGELALERARDLRRALEIYDELVALHGASWRARGQPGAFADPWFDAFHRRLITRRFASGEIDLVRITARGHTLGCLYNFTYGGRVLFYQSGLARLSDPRIKPGFLCHAAAIEDAARAGHAIYDFLGGNAHYKHSLATNETRLVWARMQHPHARFRVEEWLRARRRAA